jgi:hypothetical protein
MLNHARKAKESLIAAIEGSLLLTTPLIVPSFKASARTIEDVVGTRSTCHQQSGDEDEDPKNDCTTNQTLVQDTRIPRMNDQQQEEEDEEEENSGRVISTKKHAILCHLEALEQFLLHIQTKNDPRQNRNPHGHRRHHHLDDFFEKRPPASATHLYDRDVPKMSIYVRAVVLLRKRVMIVIPHDEWIH